MAAIAAYNHTQSIASDVWTITHNLNAYPIVDVLVNDNGQLTKIIPMNITVVDLNTCEIHFSSQRTGQARLV